ncbi:hypothetical protein V8E51_011125 [Hyaloscypha variabilis]
MRFLAIHVVFLSVLPKLSTAQAQASASATLNPLTVPPCETVLSIVESCEYKLPSANTITASMSSCFCHDASGNYAPAIYNNAVAGCSSDFPDESTDFAFWLPGLCTGAAVATGTAASSTAGISTTAVVVPTSPPTVPITTSSSTPPPNPGGFRSTSKSSKTSTNRTISALSTSGSSSSSSTGVGAVGQVSSTSSKADGIKQAHNPGDSSVLSIFLSILGAIFVL